MNFQIFFFIISKLYMHSLGLESPETNFKSDWG